MFAYSSVAAQESLQRTLSFEMNWNSVKLIMTNAKMWDLTLYSSLFKWKPCIACEIFHEMLITFACRHCQNWRCYHQNTFVLAKKFRNSGKNWSSLSMKGANYLFNSRRRINSPICQMTIRCWHFILFLYRVYRNFRKLIQVIYAYNGETV